MTPHGEVEIARARAARARHELSGTMEEILSRLTPSGFASHALSRTRAEGFSWLSLGYRIYRYRATAMTVLGLVAGWKARRDRKRLEREVVDFEAEEECPHRLYANGADRGASEMANSLKDTTGMAREKIRAAADTAAEKAAALRHTAGEKASEAYSYSRERGQKLGSEAIERMRENPVTTILGGVALGVLAGVLLPRLGSRSARSRTAGLDRYRETARETLNAIGSRLDKLNVNRESARATVAKARELAQDATMTAGKAVRDAVEQVKRDV